MDAAKTLGRVESLNIPKFHFFDILQRHWTSIHGPSQTFQISESKAPDHMKDSPQTATCLSFVLLNSRLDSEKLLQSDLESGWRTAQHMRLRRLMGTDPWNCSSTVDTQWKSTAAPRAKHQICFCYVRNVTALTVLWKSQCGKSPPGRHLNWGGSRLSGSCLPKRKTGK